MGGVSRFLGIVFLRSKRLELVCLGHARRDSFANYRPRKKKGAFCLSLTLVLSLFLIHVFIFIYSICFSVYFVFRVMRRANVELHNTLEKERKERKSAKRF